MTDPATLAHRAARLAGAPLRSLEPVGGGRNSRVFRLETEDGRTFALKAYFRHPGDTRDRLGVEFGALAFLWAQGIRCIPEPLARDAETALGLYGFLPGRRPEPPTLEDVDALCAFLADVHALRDAPGAESLPPASEANFSLAAVADHVQARLDRLAEVEPSLARDSGVDAFLSGQLRPAFARVRQDVEDRCRQAGVAFAEELPPAQRTLSPSDVGFHNALREGGRLAFLDFEYFGWDDPAKLVADFLLHPGMDLPLELRTRFAERILHHLDLDGLPLRTRLAFPLFGLKWCLILLNEFLPGDRDRRAFADPAGADAQSRQARQLDKARRKLEHVLHDHEHFPYFPV